VCAGGRFDGLVEQLGGKSVPAVGFAMGLERLVAILEETNPTAPDSAVDLYLVLQGEAALREGPILAEELRDKLPAVRLISNCGGGSMKAQFRRADRSGARYALVLGDEELEQGSVVLKPLRSGEEQMAVGRDELVGVLGSRLVS
jgi:histidyl-tRNA synthetase